MNVPFSSSAILGGSFSPQPTASGYTINTEFIDMRKIVWENVSFTFQN